MSPYLRNSIDEIGFPGKVLDNSNTLSRKESGEAVVLILKTIQDAFSWKLHSMNSANGRANSEFVLQEQFDNEST